MIVAIISAVVDPMQGLLSALATITPSDQTTPTDPWLWLALIPFGALIGAAVTIVLVPFPYWRNESSRLSQGEGLWLIRLVNRGKGEASNVVITVSVGQGRGTKKMMPKTYALRVRGEAVEFPFHLSTGQTFDGLSAKLEWDAHPLPWWRHHKRITPRSRTTPNLDDYDVSQSVH